MTKKLCSYLAAKDLATVGKPWTYNNWPGWSSIIPGTIGANFFPKNNNVLEPPALSSVSGGGKTRTRKSKHKVSRKSKHKVSRKSKRKDSRKSKRKDSRKSKRKNTRKHRMVGGHGPIQTCKNIRFGVMNIGSWISSMYNGSSFTGFSIVSPAGT